MKTNIDFIPEILQMWRLSCRGEHARRKIHTSDRHLTGNYLFPFGNFTNRTFFKFFINLFVQFTHWFQHPSSQCLLTQSLSHASPFLLWELEGSLSWVSPRPGTLSHWGLGSSSETETQQSSLVRGTGSRIRQQIQGQPLLQLLGKTHMKYKLYMCFICAGSKVLFMFTLVVQSQGMSLELGQLLFDHSLNLCFISFPVPFEERKKLGSNVLWVGWCLYSSTEGALLG